jgi:hypothetical protein
MIIKNIIRRIKDISKTIIGLHTNQHDDVGNMGILDYWQQEKREADSHQICKRITTNMLIIKYCTKYHIRYIYLIIIKRP